MLFQRVGGLQVQVLETLAALTACGVDARYIDVRSERLSDYEIVHVFGAINGNNRIVEEARDQGRPVVLSTVLHPPFSSSQRFRAELADRVAGRLTNWEVSSTYRHVKDALEQSSHLIALGKDEKEMLVNGFGQSADRVSVVPNGVSRRFFEASPELFESTFRPPRAIALCVASVDERKNQLMGARALSGLDIDYYLFGPCAEINKGYLSQVQSAAPGQVHHQGSIAYTDPVLASAYAAARVMLMPSVSEVMPIAVLEAMATGTPVVMGRNHSLGLDPIPGILEMVDHADVESIRQACGRVLSAARNRDPIRRVVQHLDWPKVALELREVYEKVI